MQAGVINMTSNKSADPLSVLFHFGISSLQTCIQAPRIRHKRWGGGKKEERGEHTGRGVSKCSGTGRGVSECSGNVRRPRPYFPVRTSPALRGSSAPSPCQSAVCSHGR